MVTEALVPEDERLRDYLQTHTIPFQEGHELDAAFAHGSGRMKAARAILDGLERELGADWATRDEGMRIIHAVISTVAAEAGSQVAALLAVRGRG